jgi:protein NrfD
MSEAAWGIPIVLYLFLSSLAAGSFRFSVLASRKQGRGFEICSRIGAFIAPISISLGVMLLIFDLKYKTRVWMLFGVFNYKSPLSVGVWLLTLFIFISLAYAIFWLPDNTRARIPLIGKWPLWKRTEFREGIGKFGIPVAMLVSVYTGVLLAVSSLPLWRNVGLPILFSLLAMSTGSAGAAVLALYFSGSERRNIMSAPLHYLQQSYRIILPFYLLSVVLYTVLLFISVNRQEKAFEIILGWKGLVWFAGAVVIAVVMPLILTIGRKKLSLLQIYIVSSLLLVGDILLRAYLVIAGQAYLNITW